MKGLFFVTLGVSWLTGCVHGEISTASLNAKNLVALDTVDLKSLEKMKKGESCIKNYLLFLSFGDKSLLEAVKNAKIDKVSFVEHRAASWIVMGENCLVVYGN